MILFAVHSLVSLSSDKQLKIFLANKYQGKQTIRTRMYNLIQNRISHHFLQQRFDLDNLIYKTTERNLLQTGNIMSCIM